jgi:tRNA pseudouridine38-40 synthase
MGRDAAPPGFTRFRADVAYDGTGLAGFQLQPGKTTVQLRLEVAIQAATGGFSRVHPSGRTDSGVHARAQVIHFDSATRMAPPQLLRAVNAHLPPEIRLTRVARPRTEFHARFDASGKEYRYFIWNDPVQDPFTRTTQWFVPWALDVAAMRRAAALLRGEHDFASFTANARRDVGSTVRHLRRLSVTREGPEITITASADGFLYKMVRSLVGFLERVGAGKLTPNDARLLLDARERNRQVPTAPAQGLFLWKVWYGAISSARADEE